MKKLLVLLTVLSIMLSTCIMGIGATASALETSPEADFIAFDGIIEEYIGPGGTVVIPSEIEGEKITEIAAYAFANNQDINEVYIAEGIEVVGYRAFYQCPNLYKIELPYSVYKAGSQAFGQSGLESLTVPGGLEILEYGFAGGNPLKEVVISYGVKEILTSSFGGGYNKEVIIPESVEIFCGFSFTFPEDKGGSKFIVCNPDVEIGMQVQLPQPNLNHEWDTSGPTGGIVPPSYSAVDSATMTYVFPEGSKAGKFAEEKFQAFCDSTKGSSCDVSHNKMRIVYEDEAYFEKLFEDCDGAKNWGITKTRKDLSFTYGENGGVAVGGDEGTNGDAGSDEGGNSSTNDSNKNGSTSSNKNNGGSQTIIEGGDNSTMWIVLAVVGVVFVLLIVGVVIFLVIFLKPKKKAPTAEELRAQLAAAEAAEKVEAPIEEAPADDAE